ncbi:GNAT family N-acetyltransferase [Bowmanella denitrificans]|uniref:GNAT family N-acetyltransferase n=1 Tax=Bowmanella denitrificans TaxID=366582 RepID=A0ABN0X288_9ALTE
MDLKFSFIDSLKRICPKAWQKLAADAGPFLHYHFLSALEASQCVGGSSGWQPKHLLIEDNLGIAAVMPLYEKWHSYGEYVFDFAWADAYAAQGLNYYPKLLAGIPFTPVPGDRLLVRADLNVQLLWQDVVRYLQQQCQLQHYSSIHLLFLQQADSDQLQPLNCVQRHSIQFHWYNRRYHNFGEFVATFNSRKRKNLLKERRKLADSGLTFRRLSGADLSAADMDDFYQCYCNTYLKRSGHTGYLNRAFFNALVQSMPEQMLLVQAHKNQQLLACALLFYDHICLYGRYWGCIEEVDGLHFELCYYQGIEFCIEKGLLVFNPGTQGEHKLLRGFEPTLCFSNHWLAHDRLHSAVHNFIQHEKQQLASYKDNAMQFLPFARGSQHSG